MGKIGETISHLFHLLPLSKVDYSRLGLHLFAAWLLAMSTIFTAGVTFHIAMITWLGASLSYSAGYLQRSIGEDEVLLPGEHLLNTKQVIEEDKQDGQ